jgi:diacylglycerol kinase family enzyme
MGDLAGLGRRARLDRARLGLFAVTVASGVQAIGLLAGTRLRGLARMAAPEIVVDADASQIPVGVVGEALMLDTPVRCTIRPAALRVRVPRDRPGVPDPKPSWTGSDWGRSP